VSPGRGCVGAERGKVGFDHLPDHRLEADLGLPAQVGPRPLGIADRRRGLGRADERRIHPDAPLGRDPRRGEGHVDQIAYGVPDARGDDVVARFVLLQHEPRRASDVRGVAPVADGVEVPENHCSSSPRAMAAAPCVTLRGKKRTGSARGLVVEEDAGRHVQSVTLAHRPHETEGGQLCHAVGRARAHRGLLGER
jgi:hypothetical protein